MVYVLIESVNEVSCVDIGGEFGVSLMDFHIFQLGDVLLHFDQRLTLF